MRQELEQLRGLYFMGLLIAFIIASSFVFEGNSSDDDDCLRYSNIANDC
jgi:hypothetical protein